MELNEISQKTGVSSRQLCYVIDHHLVPGVTGEGRGVTRELTLDVAQGVALAALLLESGIKRKLVRQCFEVLRSEDQSAGVWTLKRALAPGNAWLEIADGAYVRLSPIGARNQNHDVRWLPLDGGTRVKISREFTVVVRVNLAMIRAALTA